MAALLPSGIVTFVFTDIAGSTRLFHELGPRYAGLLGRHNEILRDAFGAHGGVEVKSEGDALFFAFGDATGALEGCIRGQEGLARGVWPHRQALLVRMGVHTGEAVAVHGDYIALAVHQAARIVAAAHGGQVVVSDTTVAAAGAPEGTKLTDLGLHLLKDFDAPQRLWQLDRQGELRRFPPLRTRSLTLPSPRTTFIGRGHELDVLVKHLAAPGLVSLVGPGGVGKTRLAVEAAAALAAVDVAGVHLVELTDERDASAVAGLLARQLGAVVRPDRAALDAVVTDIGVRRALVVLDNCEGAIDGAATVAAALVTGCPSVTVLATSRAPLEVDGEVVMRISPLPTAGVDRASDAVRLLLDRMASAIGRSTFTSGEVDAAVEICDRLDGLPLAIELAAATAARVPIAALAGELDDRLDLLRGRGRVARQQTLRKLLDWSHELLSKDARSVFRRLALLPAPFDLDVVRPIADAFGDVPRPAVGRAVAELVDQSLLSVDDRSGRYRLLETMRLYAGDELDAAGERPVVEGALIEWAVGAASALDVDADPVGAGRQLDLDYPNLAVALDLADRRRDPRLVQLCGALGRYWHLRGMSTEGVAWCDRALTCPGVPTSATTEVELRRARLLIELGKLDHAVAALEAVRPALGATGTTRQRLEARLYWMSAIEQLGRLDEAHQRGQELLVDARAAGDTSVEARCLNHLGIVAFGRADFASARDRYQESLNAATAAGLAREVPIAHVNLGEVLLELGDVEQAQEHLETSATLARNQAQHLVAIAALELLAATHANDDRRAELQAEITAISSRIGPEVRTAVDRQMAWFLAPGESRR